MPIIAGTLLVPGPDYGASVSATNVEANGQTVYITYVDASGNLKVGVTSLVQNVDQSIRVAMSGCTVS